MGNVLYLNDDRIGAGPAGYGDRRTGGEGSGGGIEKHLEQRAHFLVIRLKFRLQVDDKRRGHRPDCVKPHSKHQIPSDTSAPLHSTPVGLTEISVVFRSSSHFFSKSRSRSVEICCRSPLWG